MKKATLFAMLVLVAVGFVVLNANANAQTISLGLHGAYTMGGDIERSNNGLGGQVVIPFGELSMEVSGTKFQDGIDDLLIDTMTIAVSMRYGQYVANNKMFVYGGGGFNHNSYTASVAWPGFSVDIEDAIGFHVAAGVSTLVHEKAEIFAEYRYSMVSSTARVGSQCTGYEIVTGSANFGLVRIGVNFLF